MAHCLADATEAIRSGSARMWGRSRMVPVLLYLFQSWSFFIVMRVTTKLYYELFVALLHAKRCDKTPAWKPCVDKQ